MIEPDEAGDPIRIHDKKERDIPVPENEEAAAIRENVNRINKFTAGNCINLFLSDEGYVSLKHYISEKNKTKKKYEPRNMMPDLRNTSLERIFSKSLRRGGRFYSVWWQNTPSKYRQLIDINGEPTVEVDYAYLHPMLLYSMKGVQLEQDPYMLDGLDKASRSEAKIALNVMINATTEKKAAKAIRREVKFYNLPEQYNTAEKLMAAYKVRHEQIKEYFNSGAWDVLQYKDSRIAERVMLTLMEQGIVCLCVHDSFIVQRRHEEQLKQAMMDSFINEVNGIVPKLKVSSTEFFDSETSVADATYGTYLEYQDYWNSKSSDTEKTRASIRKKAVPKKSSNPRLNKEANEFVAKYGKRAFNKVIVPAMHNRETLENMYNKMILTGQLVK